MPAGRTGAQLPFLAWRGQVQKRERIDELCEFAPAEGALEDLVFWFVRLIAWIRPRRGEDARTRVRFFRARLDASPEFRARVAAALKALVQQVDIDTFLAYGGIPRDFHLLSVAAQWVTANLLPSACRTDDMERIICLALQERDLRWVRSSALAALLFELLPTDEHARFAASARNAALDLVHEVVAQTHAPSVRKLDADVRSPFRGLYDAVAGFIDAPEERALYQAVRGRVCQCQRALNALRVGLSLRGADLNTTFRLVRVERQLGRLDLLVVAAFEGRASASRIAMALVQDALFNARARHLFAKSSELLVRNLVDTTADVGDDYLDTQRSSFHAAFFAGCAGGLLMVVATLIKIALSTLRLPPLYEGLVFSLNYATAFCTAYLLHYTIATKLPAHTAAALARSVGGPLPRRQRIAAFVAAARALVRLQFGGLLGNLVVAGPFALGVALVFRRIAHYPLVSPEKAEHLLHANSALGPSAVYAVITGIFLWVSSLAGAVVENWAKVNGVRASLATGVTVMRTVGVARAEPMASAVGSKLGGFVGNVFLGFLLGGVPAAFAIAQLPIEIRHVTVSASSVALAAGAPGAGARAIILGVIGVLLIGAVNVLVSFALALHLALRAAQDEGSSRLLVRVGIRRLLGHRSSSRVVSRGNSIALAMTNSAAEAHAEQD